MFIRRLFLLLLVLAAAGAGLVYSGVYNVAANAKPTAAEQWLLETVRDHSIARRAKAIAVPPLGAPEQIRQGFELYRALCRGCHGGAGGWPEEPAMGLHPVPPGLGQERVQKLSDAELFWVIQNGIRFTGMPSFGAMHEDADLWALVAFTRQLPKLSDEDFERLAREAEAAAAKPAGTEPEKP
ncbi:MAG TPA: cytochrome c [Thermoanaerobaculia bacterium]|mgnify:CR=1 FL=1|nr:cytochrome c [Thermoanaerobaculia bacterium]